MHSAQVFVFSAVLAASSIVARSIPNPGLLTGLFGGDDQNQNKPSPVDINQLLRQYYMSPTEDTYNQYNPFGAASNYAPPSYAQSPYAPQPNIPPVPSYAQQPSYGPHSYPQLNYGSPYAAFPEPSFGGQPGGGYYGNQFAGSFPTYRGGPSERASGNEDSLNQYGGDQVDSYLPGGGKGGFQNFAASRFLMVPSPDDQQVQNAEVLPPSQAALRAPAVRVLNEGSAERSSSRTNSAEASSNSKQ